MDTMYDSNIMHNLLHNGAAAVPMYNGHIGMFNYNIPYAEVHKVHFVEWVFERILISLGLIDTWVKEDVIKPSDITARTCLLVIGNKSEENGFLPYADLTIGIPTKDYYYKVKNTSFNILNSVDESISIKYIDSGLSYLLQNDNTLNSIINYETKEIADKIGLINMFDLQKYMYAKIKEIEASI